MSTHLLYLHGFRSSPQSAKAQAVQRWVQTYRPDVQWLCPQLPPSPAQAMDEILEATKAWQLDSACVMGSSLGGFYATVVAELRGWRAVVLNPAVNPARDLARHIGEHSAWHDPSLRFTFEARHVEELRLMTPTTLTRLERYGGIIALGDEVLNGSEMAERYRGSAVTVIPGGDHGLSTFEKDHLANIMGWLQRAP